MAASKEKAKGRPKPKAEPVAVNEKTTGGCTGKGFVPGQSGNPSGRPKKFMSLVTEALREKLKDIEPESKKTYAEALADKLVEEALSGQIRVKAIAEIVDRVEGKPKQQIDLNDVTDKFSGRTKEELLYYSQHGKFPDETTIGG